MAGTYILLSFHLKTSPAIFSRRKYTLCIGKHYSLESHIIYFFTLHIKCCIDLTFLKQSCLRCHLFSSDIVCFFGASLAVRLLYLRAVLTLWQVAEGVFGPHKQKRQQSGGRIVLLDEVYYYKKCIIIQRTFKRQLNVDPSTEKRK